jgi:hypothetical protein
MKLTTPDLTRYTKALGYGDALRPARDWLVLLALAFVLVLASLGWHLLTFRKVVEGEPLDPASTDMLPKTARVETVTAYFEARSLEATRYVTEYRFVDPSRTAGTVTVPQAEVPTETPVTTTATTTP